MARPSRQPPRSKIAARRLEAELSQRQLAELTGISIRNIQRLDWGQMDNPPLRYLVNIATVLEVDVFDICEDDWFKWAVLDDKAKKPPGTRRRRSGSA